MLIKNRSLELLLTMKNYRLEKNGCYYQLQYLLVKNTLIKDLMFQQFHSNYNYKFRFFNLFIILKMTLFLETRIS